MTEILLFLPTLLAVGLHAWYVRETNRQKDRLIDALISKTAGELRDLRIAGNTKIEVKPTKQPDLIPLDQVDDETLTKIEGNDGE